MSNRKKPAKRTNQLSGARNPVVRPGQVAPPSKVSHTANLLARAGVDGDLSSLHVIAQEAGRLLTRGEVAYVAARLAYQFGCVLRNLPEDDRAHVLWQFENAEAIVASAISDATNGQVAT